MKSVLIVDRSAESREVLRTVLQMRGVQTWEAGEGSAGLELARQQHPDVILLDVEGAAASDALCDEYAAQAADNRTSLVLIGTLRQPASGPQSEIVRKPYQYGPLIRRIEQLLAEPSPPRRAAA